jgi:uncharacterized protein (DUF2132 family)
MVTHISKDPLHGVTLAMILERLVERYGWEELGKDVKIRCFNFNPSIKSSLAFLRKTPWARKKVEDIYRESERQRIEELHINNSGEL